MVKINGVSKNIIRLRLFWFLSGIMNGLVIFTITRKYHHIVDMISKFLAKYFLTAKSVQQRLKHYVHAS